MRFTAHSVSSALAAWSVLPGATQPPPRSVRRPFEFFEKHVRPVLVSKCQSCHGPKRQQGGLRLDSRAALLKGSDNGAVVVPGQPDKSLLVRAIRYDGDVQMPPKNKLPAEVHRPPDHLDQDGRSMAGRTPSRWTRTRCPWPRCAARTGRFRR